MHLKDTKDAADTSGVRSKAGPMLAVRSTVKGASDGPHLPREQQGPRVAVGHPPRQDSTDNDTTRPIDPNTRAAG